MGEKIRDLQPIHIGRAELMIELNEGYTKNEGRLIHVQNKHFRYLLKEKNFLKMAGAILRSRRQMEYIKSETGIAKIQPIHTESAEASEKVKGMERTLGDTFERETIRYRIVSDGEKFVTILIHPDDRKNFHHCFETLNAKKLDHPYTEKAGYVYLYQMTPFELYVYENTYIEVYFQLPCMSLTPKNWIPLDRAVQTHVWKNEQKDENGCLMLDPIAKIIFLCGWSVFSTHCFSERTRAYIHAHREFLAREELMELMQTVFFHFSEQLCELLMHEEYDRVIDAFYRFDQY